MRLTNLQKSEIVINNAIKHNLIPGKRYELTFADVVKIGTPNSVTEYICGRFVQRLHSKRVGTYLGGDYTNEDGYMMAIFKMDLTPWGTKNISTRSCLTYLQLRDYQKPILIP